jgi:ribosome maturation factor RimP
MSGPDAIESAVEAALAEALPQVDLLEVTVTGRGESGVLRAVVDHPDGVDHEVCVQVTRVLEGAGLLERYSIEVWSPGPEPPLRVPEHFRRAVGRRVKVVEGRAKRSHTGTLVEVDADGVRLDEGGEVVHIPFSEVRRARALESAGAT